VTNGHRGTDRQQSSPASEMQTLVSRKGALRAEAMRRRDRVAAETGPDIAARAVRDRVLDSITVPPGSTVSAFWPMGSEIDLRPLIHALHDAGHPIGLPVVVGRGQPLLFRAWRPGLALVPGGYGTQVPGTDQPEVRPAVLLVPLLAFDRAGYRLGYGGGFYDRTLAALRADGPACAVGVAYAGQEVPEVPRADYDQRLDWIVTDREAIRIA
jgi:5-formyltetrahydrofolate cyclo-ligase